MRFLILITIFLTFFAQEQCVYCQQTGKLLGLDAFDKPAQNSELIDANSFLDEAGEILSGYQKLIKEPVGKLTPQNYQTIDKLYPRILSIAEKPKISLELKSRAYLIYSGFIGIKGLKESNSKIGKESFSKLELSVDINPQNALAVEAFATTILKMRQKNVVKKYFMVRTLEIDLDEKKDKALKLLENLPLNERRQKVATALKARD